MIFEQQMYDPLEPEAFPVFYFYIFIALFSLFMTIRSFAKWSERKMKAPLLLSITFLLFSLCIASLMIGLMEAVIYGEKRVIYRFSLAFAYSTIMIANCFLLYFASEIFSFEKRYLKKYIIISLIIAVFLALPYNYYGVPEALVDNSKNIRPYTGGALVVFSILTYSRIFSVAYRVSKRVEEKQAKTGFLFIALSQICLILFFVFVFIDTLIFTLTDLSGYTISLYIAWVWACLFLVSVYIGLFMPDWVRKRFLMK